MSQTSEDHRYIATYWIITSIDPQLNFYVAQKIRARNDEEAEQKALDHEEFLNMIEAARPNPADITKSIFLGGIRDQETKRMVYTSGYTE